jgi:FMN phosphatase YigB (HAD superfamily)
MSKYEEANLILKLYELRREEVMRKARDWYFMEFHPESLADLENAMFSEHSGHLRMVTSYWEMAAALVQQGAISLDMFAATNGEHYSVFAKLEPLLGEIRAKYGSQAYANLEKLIDATPDGRQKVQAIRERIKAVRARVSDAGSQGR